MWDRNIQGIEDSPWDNWGMDSWDRNIKGTQKTVHGTIPWIKGSAWMDSSDRNMQGTQKTVHGTIPWIKGSGLIVGTGTCKEHKDCPWDNPMDQGKGIDSWDRSMQGTQKTVHGTIPWIKGSEWIVGTGTCKGHRRQSMGQSHGSRKGDG